MILLKETKSPVVPNQIALFTYLLFLNCLKINKFFPMLIQNNIGSNKFKLVDKKC